MALLANILFILMILVFKDITYIYPYVSGYQIRLVMHLRINIAEPIDVSFVIFCTAHITEKYFP